jgi:hypothetical protein
VIDVKVAEEEDVWSGHLRAALAKAKGAASAGVKDDAGFAVLPYEIAR